MTHFDPYDDAALHAEALAEVRRDSAAHALRVLLDRRPPAFADDGQLHPQVRAWTDRVLQGDARQLVLIGPVGTGKTWSLWKAAETLVRRGWRGRFELATSYELKEATDRPVDREQLRIWAEADLLAIDDLGAQRLNDWDADAIGALIDRRWQRRRPILVASNVADLRGLLGERAASRLADGATIVTFTGEDRRRGRS